MTTVVMNLSSYVYCNISDITLHLKSTKKMSLQCWYEAKTNHMMLQYKPVTYF